MKPNSDADDVMEHLMSAPVRNPRYKGATMKDVARALFRPTGPRSRREPVRSDERPVGQTPTD